MASVSISSANTDVSADYARASSTLNPEPMPSIIKISSDAVVATGTEDPAILPDVRWSPSVSVARLYPHVFDSNEPAGQAVFLMQQAHDDSVAALELYGAADLAGAQARLTQIAVIASKAWQLSDFNPSFAAVVAFVRRAMLVAQPDTITRESLNTLCSVLHILVSDPMLHLAGAADLAERLSAQGWAGDHPGVDRLIQAILGELPEASSIQWGLFDEQNVRG